MSFGVKCKERRDKIHKTSVLSHCEYSELDLDGLCASTNNILLGVEGLWLHHGMPTALARRRRNVDTVPAHEVEQLGQVDTRVKTHVVDTKAYLRQ